MEQSKQMGIISNQAQPRGTLKILWEGLKLPYNNFALLYPILLLSFLLSYLCPTPDLTAILIGNTDPKSPRLLPPTNRLPEGLERNRVPPIISSIVRSLVAAATVHVLSTAYSSKTPSKLKEAFARLNWSLIKRCMITQLYGVLVSLGCSLMVLLTAVVLYFSFIYYPSSGSYDVGLMVIFALGVIVAVLELCLLLYWFMVLNISVVVSVVEEEEGCYGLDAIAKASKLVRGRRKQAILIALVEFVVAVVLYAGYDLVMDPAAPANMARLALGLGQVALGVVVNVLIWSVQTVYYYECSAGHVEGIAMEGGFKYNPVPTQVDEALL